MFRVAAPLALALSAALAVPAAAEDIGGKMRNLANGAVKDWLSQSIVMNSVRAQNARYAGIDEQRILELDGAWRDQTLTGGPMIDTVLANPLSEFLRGVQEQSQGRFSEIFITDAYGLNVGQSAVTSDFWQGDEDKWQVPVATGDIHVSEVEFDESSQTYQSQLSVPIRDAGQIIGVVTVGVNVEMLAQLD